MRLLPAAILLCATLAGCSSVALGPAPVVSKSATPVVAVGQPAASAPASAAAPAAVPPGYYRVQPGDTLRSIARSVGQPWQNLAAWNQLGNPNLIEVGQLLRIIPPAGSAASAPAVVPLPSQSAAVRRLGAAPQGMASQPRAPASASRRQPASMPAPAAPPTPPPAPSGPVVGAPKAHSMVGGLEWSWPAQGKMVQAFNGTTSKGIDIAGRAGEPVRAAASGKVVYAGNELRGFGNLIIIKHNSEYISVYAHNQSMLVKDGQEVRRGQVIALMGSTDASRVELHFEIRLRGKPVDPLQVLPAH